MQHQALYRKWRPQTFGDVCGQEHITSILEYETEHNKFSHAYLFCGSRGTGKTTCAKILAKAVNCESPVNGSPCNCCPSCKSIDLGTTTDVLEMDAASNNGVDNIRDIRDEVVYSPTSLKYRVYIVDEVHMLSGSAFNALLKTLEEPPAHAIFILATTELHKLPSTIVSRCQRYDFRRISTDTLVDRLAYIADNEDIKYTREALRVIAKMALGGMRDAISLLELCAGNRTLITPELVNDTLGTGGRDNSEAVVRAIAENDFDAIFAAVDKVVTSSKDLSVFWQDLAAFYRDMLVIKTTRSAKSYLDLTDEEAERLYKTAELFTKERLLYHCRVIDDTLFMLQKGGAEKRIVAEMALIKMCDTSLDNSTDSLMARVAKLEGILASGNIPTTAVPIKSKVIVEERKEAIVSTDTANTQSMQKEPDKTPALVKTMKVLRGWSEIVDKFATTDGSVAGFLRNAKALTDGDGKIYIRFSNDFARGMVDKKHTREALRGAMCITLERTVNDEDIILGLLEGDEDSICDLDEFNFDENKGDIEK